VVAANVLFSNHPGVKPRPALVIGAEAFHRNLSDVIASPRGRSPRLVEHTRAGVAGYRKEDGLDFCVPT
jgi:hypothetical protein